ncbi:DUF3265 domain-containing protein [Vibrio vulnificus]|nr:DUF3265 domain-containing protein [Vibrio cholerae]MCU8168052.1 DUF3265 domain-containing protein [Vibrio vulnificus]EKF6289630.1 DUF3265 domain-containing protein [Vibrio cholerae]MCU8404582.1 DUF3265 domain-containing protein [Vibrio vulnificus]HAS3583373.1 DUF3265 domain-containing protein [Vibrio cholerae]
MYSELSVVCNLTNNLSVIQHAWRFYYALVLVVKVVYSCIGGACFTP